MPNKRITPFLDQACSVEHSGRVPEPHSLAIIMATGTEGTAGVNKTSSH
jgi:hypothetical protein